VTDFFTFLVQGFSQGAIFALVAVGYVVIYKATHVLNFGQAALLALGAYIAYTLNGGLTSQFAEGFRPWSIAHFPWVIALICAMFLTAGLGLMIEKVVLAKFRDKPVFATIMATFGLAIIAQALTGAVWGEDPMSLNEPIGIKSYTVKKVPITLQTIVILVVALAVVGLFLLFFKYSRFGTAMRATAFDQEAAMAQGISAKSVYAASWAIAAGMAALAAILFSSGNGQTINQTSLQLLTFAAFPAIVLGGVDSTNGAIAGGMIIGIAQQLMLGYQSKINTALGTHIFTNFHNVFPFVIMLFMLLVRPYGLFGTKEVRRV
jgi:branched-chain amino acid transport system permease protein